MSSDPLRFNAELGKDPELCGKILADLAHFPVALEEPRVLIRCDAAHVDQAIARAFALAVLFGEIVKLELIGG